MAITDFIPELWAASLIRHLDPILVYAASDVINRNYEGEIRDKGDTVHIQNVDDVTVGTYVPGNNIVEEAADVDIDTELNIDQYKYWSVKVDDVHEIQSNPALMDEKTRRAAVGIGQVVDTFVASMQADVVAAGFVLETTKVEGETTKHLPIEVKEAAEAYELLVDLQTQQDEQDIPEQGRFVIVPPWYHGLLEKDNRFVGAGTDGAVLHNGRVGQAAGFSVRKSNRVPNTEGKDFRILAGTNQGITYADQFVKTEALRHPFQFADVARGLHVFGAKVPNPQELSVLRVTKGA